MPKHIPTSLPPNLGKGQGPSEAASNLETPLDFQIYSKLLDDQKSSFRGLKKGLRNFQFRQIVAILKDRLSLKYCAGIVDESEVERSFHYIIHSYHADVGNSLISQKLVREPGADEITSIQEYAYVLAMSGPGAISLEVFDRMTPYAKKDEEIMVLSLQKAVAEMAFSWLLSNGFIKARPVKLVLIGEANVGKTALIRRFTKDVFSPSTTTIAAEYFKRTVLTSKGVSEISVLDTAGQERYQAMSDSFIRGSDGVIVVFDDPMKVTDETLLPYVTQCNNYDKPYLIFTNKSDLWDASNSTDQVKGMESRYFGSAKTGSGVSDAFTALIEQILAVSSSSSSKQGVIDLQSTPNSTPSSKGCCW